MLEERTGKEGLPIYEYSLGKSDGLDYETTNSVRGRIEVQKVNEHYIIVGKVLFPDPRISLHRFEREDIGSKAEAADPNYTIAKEYSSQIEATEAARIVARRYAAKWADYCRDLLFDTTQETS